MSQSKLLGSTLIIAGTTIGAGMLALPLASAGIGFSVSLMMMVILWAVMAFTALLMVELHQYAASDATLHTLSEQILGTKGRWIASFAMCFLFYALCAAYIAGGGAQFAVRLEQWFDWQLTPQAANTLFTLIVATVVAVGTATVDKVNRVLFTLKLLAMALVLFFLAPNVTGQYLLNMPLGQGLVVAALPVIFTSFGFHGSIPAIVRYLEGDTPALKKAVVIGSAIPLVIYLFWQIVTLGVVSQQTLITQTGLGALIAQLGVATQTNGLAQLVGIFADLALITSFLGVSLGLFEFVGDSAKQTRVLNRVPVVTFITFVPPLLFALYFPQGFILALGYAAIALAILAIFLPVAMVIRVRRDDERVDERYRVAGGHASLVIVSMMGMAIVVTQLMISGGLLPALG
ncbi:amino acid permease [Vibrio sp. SM6]|uniref:Aromatic amino acid permease n=1 Tax=Vibrio agarilyticus TaxID=2726741 RepID=A0A7X8YGP4_9VIBR|nr:aromatic amino acid transport family protein [Vibrio agarilyticus]NLS12626.1 amino acid permease [Vibrio agarilyticus]